MREEEGTFALGGAPQREGRPVPRRDSCLLRHSTAGSWTGAALAVYTHISAELTAMWTSTTIHPSCTTQAKMARGQDTVRECMRLHAKLLSPQMQYQCWQAG